MSECLGLCWCHCCLAFAVIFYSPYYTLKVYCSMPMNMATVHLYVFSYLMWSVLDVSGLTLTVIMKSWTNSSWTRLYLLSSACQAHERQAFHNKQCFMKHPSGHGFIGMWRDLWYNHPSWLFLGGTALWVYFHSDSQTFETWPVHVFLCLSQQPEITAIFSESDPIDPGDVLSSLLSHIVDSHPRPVAQTK